MAPMTTLLQLVLDEPGEGVSVEAALGLADLIDALEIGPRLLQVHGPPLVRAVRDAMPDRAVVCWAETADEATALLEAGIAGLTIPASLPDGTLKAIIAVGRRAGRRVLLDLKGGAEPERVMALKPDCVKVPVEVNVREVLGGLRPLDLPVAFSGDWSVAQVPWLLVYRPVALVAGPVVATAPEPRRILEAVRARMAITPTMSRFY
ncbi:MAG TPA: hypothetical protein VIH84_03470 [Candidatus Methylomirabilis sp.]